MCAAACDNCATVTNPSQADGDQDGAGDVCDTCPLSYNPSQIDADADGLGDVCDNCVASSNADQVDGDGDGERRCHEPLLPLLHVASSHFHLAPRHHHSCGLCVVCASATVCDNCAAIVNDQADADFDGVGNVRGVGRAHSLC
jgi:hypothetical protein